MNIMSRFQSVFQRIFDTPELTLSPETTAADIEGWDSLLHLRLILALEKEFDIRFHIGEVAEVKNVGELLSLVEKSLNLPQ